MRVLALLPERTTPLQLLVPYLTKVGIFSCYLLTWMVEFNASACHVLCDLEVRGTDLRPVFRLPQLT